MPKVDLAIFQTESVQSLTNDTGGRQISGAEKLLQRFIIELLTARGSVLFATDRGTDYADAITAMSGMTELDAYADFHQAVEQARQGLQRDELEDDPLDEQFADASINSLVIADDETSINITVTSRAGTSSNITMPIVFTGTVD